MFGKYGLGFTNDSFFGNKHLGDIYNELYPLDFFGNTKFNRRYLLSDFMNFNKYKEDNNVILEVAIPGFNKEDIKITVAQKEGFINVEAKKKLESDREDDKEFEIRQFNTYEIKNCFEIPDGVDIDNITSTFENGVLKLVMPLKEDEILKERIIEIQ